MEASPASDQTEASTPTQVAVDTPVCLAFQLGWDMSNLYHQARTRDKPPQFTIEEDEKTHERSYPKLPAQRDFKGSLRTERRLTAVSAGLFRLTDSLELAGFKRPSMDRVRAVFEGGERDALKEEIYRLHVRTLLDLQAADPRVGSAYNLGRAMVATVTAESSSDLQKQFRRARITGLINELRDLISALPAHAGQAVAISLCSWQRALGPQLKDRKPGNKPPKLGRRLDRQGEMWRAILSGEKNGPDVLGAEDYMTAANQLLERAGNLAGRILRTYWIALAAAVAVVLLGLAVGIGLGGVGGTVAAIGAAAAAFGISWKGVGATVTGLAGQLRGPLWGAELDLAIAEAITVDEIRDAYEKLPESERRCEDLRVTAKPI